MTRIHVFADESGNFDFSKNPGASKYYILTTVTFFDDKATCGDLDSLRYDLAWRGTDHPGPFHATEDDWPIRKEVYAAFAPHKFRVDSLILEKSKAQPHLRNDAPTFYQYAWWLHMKYLAPKIASKNDELLVIAASIGVKKMREAFHRSVQRVMTQVTPSVNMKTAAWRDDSDTGLQVADYCCWALKRKWEDGDLQCYGLIQNKIRSEFPVFQIGQTHYY